MAATARLTFRVQLVIPQHRELYDYWIRCAENRDMPARADISPAEITHLLPSISLVDVSPGKNRFRVRLAGTRLRGFYQREITGQYLDELEWGDRADYWMAAYQRVVEQRRPTQGVVRSPRHEQDHIVQFWLRLPLSCDGEDVNMILCSDAFIPSSQAPNFAEGEESLTVATQV